MSVFRRIVGVIVFAVEVHNLRKEFFRRDATRTRGASGDGA
jgi:hypothetical protein